MKGLIFHPHLQFQIPLADQFRRRPAKPQRLVQFQHGIHFKPLIYTNLRSCCRAGDFISVNER
jgi:hypothetical protein